MTSNDCWNFGEEKKFGERKRYIIFNDIVKLEGFYLSVYLCYRFFFFFFIEEFDIDETKIGSLFH